MVVMWTRTRGTVVLVVLAVLLAGCTPDRECTLIGCLLGRLSLTNLESAAPGATTVTVCTDSDCAPPVSLADPGLRPGNADWTYLDLSGQKKPKYLTMTWSRGSESLKTLRLDNPKVTVSEPNGKGCGECHSVGTISYDPATDRIATG